MTRGERVWKEAQSWKGTPFVPQASVKGRGCDCKGLVWGVARELHYPEADTDYANFIAYDIGARGGIPCALLKEGMAALFDRKDEVRTGDILLLKARNGSTIHLAIAGPDDRAIHAQIGHTSWVKDTSLSRVLLKVYSLDSIWRWRDGN